MSQTKEARNKAMTFQAFDTIFNKQDIQDNSHKHESPPKKQEKATQTVIE
jgi:hypothetical protein